VTGDHSVGHYTHEKNPVLARAALATLEVIDDEHLVQRADELGAYARRRLDELAAHVPVVGNVRGVGLLLGVDLSNPDGSPDNEGADRALYLALERGLTFKVTMGSVLTLSPPLTVTKEELDQGLDILASCLQDVSW
jgi:4-aminobutyrate aminotransferase